MEQGRIFHGIPDRSDIDSWRELNIPFEYNDFISPQILDDREEVEKRIGLYLLQDRDRSLDTVHGPFLDIAVHSSDPLIRQVSDKRIRQGCDIALRLGAKALILHTNLIGNFYDPAYRNRWLEENARYFTELLADYPKLEVYMENMFDEEPDSLVALAERMAAPENPDSSARFGICLDIGHAHLSKTPVAVWLEATMPYVRHYHINDNDGVTDQHLPPGQGTVPWNEVIPRLDAHASVLLEVRSLEGYRNSRISILSLSG